MTETRRSRKAKEKTENPGGLPYGFGSMMMRGAKWWMIYRSVAGERVQENTFTADINEARVILCRTALRIAAERAALLEGALEAAEVVLEQAKEAGDNQPAREAGRSEGGRRLLRDAPADRRADRARKGGKK
jgi:hypothetical protein